MEQFFQLKQHGTTVRTEIMAGFTTFMAMAYILMVNAGMFAELEGQVTYNAVYIATAISAVIGTVLIGLLSNLPLAQASGMGLNAYFVYTVCFGIGLSYGISGVINRFVNMEEMNGLTGNLSRIPPWLSLAAVGFAIFVGMAAGFMPAMRAMKLSPLAAIRND